MLHDGSPYWAPTPLACDIQLIFTLRWPCYMWQSRYIMWGDKPLGDVSVDGEPSEGVNNDRSALMHIPDQSNCARSPPDIESRCLVASIEPTIKQQVSIGQHNTKWLEHTFDGRLSHVQGPPSPYPVPIPTPAVRWSSQACRAPICDDNQCFFINAYERSTLEEEIQLNEGGTDDLPGHIESLDNGGERETHADVTESHCDVLTQSAECAATATLLDIEPLTFNNTIEHPDANLWLAAMEVELNTFKEIGLYQEVGMPCDHKIIDSKWVFKIKRGPNSKINKYKARLVTKGYTQIEGLDYTDMFAPITKFTTIRSLLALAAQHDLKVHQIDIKATFLNGKLEEEIYLHPPPGFCNDPKVVWQLLHALYGLKQASKAWYDMLWKMFESLRFMLSEADHSLFYKDKDGGLLIVAVYVDDKPIFLKNLNVVKHLKMQLSNHFEITDLGKARWILGMEVICDRLQGTITL